MRYALTSIVLLILLVSGGCGGGGTTPDRSVWFSGTWEITGLTVAEDTGSAHTWKVGDHIWFTSAGLIETDQDDNTPSFATGEDAPAQDIDEVLINSITRDTCLYHYRFVQDPLGKVNDVRWEIKAAFTVSSPSSMTGWIRTELEHGADPLDIDDVDVTLTKVSDELVGTPLVFR